MTDLIDKVLLEMHQYREADLAEIERLRAALLARHWDSPPGMIEGVDGYGEPTVDCGVCADPWPCWAAEALGEQP